MKSIFRFLLPALLALTLPCLLSAQWLLTGNAPAAVPFLGTVNAQPVNFITDGVPRMQLSAGGFLGIGTGAPLYRFHVENATNARSGYFTNTFASALPTYGLYAETSNIGTGTETAGFFKAQGSGTGANFGVDAHSSQSSATNYGVRSTVTGGGTSTNYGVRSTVTGSGTSTNYGLSVAVTPSATVNGNYGVYSTFTNATTALNNFSGYFNNGKVYIGYRLGIGVQNPATVLHVQGGENTGSTGTIKITSITGGVSENMLLDGDEIDVSTGGLHLNGNTGGNVLLANGGGRVGIGTVSPGVNTKLHVRNGDLRLDRDGEFFDFKVGSGGDLRVQRNGNHTALWIGDTTGRVGIGTDEVAAGYKLSVKGKIISEEVRVELFEDWPDYVFGPDYKLTSLPEVKSFVEANHHLPGIPSADEVEKDGLHLGEMQTKMMAKVEELYLHIIEINERVEVLEKENATLRHQSEGKK